MIYDIKRKIILYIVGSAVSIGSVYFVYTLIKDRGYAEARAECVSQFNEYQLQLNDKIAGIEESLGNVAASSQEQQQLLSQDITEILTRVKKQPITIIKNGKCTPAPEF